jgi:ubiquitin-protein ligase
VEGPDGRSFRFSDVPASSPVGSVGEELIDQYPEGLPGSDQPLVIDKVAADGTGERANPDSTLHEEGITEGSRLRVGFQRRAAAVNPLDRRDALFRVLNQMQLYVDTQPGFTVWPNSPTLPTEYDIEFTQPSFGPPASYSEQPPDIELHQLSIVLGPDFPITAPRVRWLTEIYHPNVFPTYECGALTAREYMRGLVCLGALAESYQPSLDFTELCATLRDIAGYRNYSVFIPADDAVDPLTGQPLLQGDYYDGDAARWAISGAGQERIRKIGGAPVLRLMSAVQARYGFEIEPDA